MLCFCGIKYKINIYTRLYSEYLGEIHTIYGGTPTINHFSFSTAKAYTQCVWQSTWRFFLSFVCMAFMFAAHSSPFSLDSAETIAKRLAVDFFFHTEICIAIQKYQKYTHKILFALPTNSS